MPLPEPANRQQAVLQAGIAAFQQAEYGQALLCFEQLLPSQADNANLHQYLCLSHKAQHNYPQALQHAQRAAELAPQRAGHWGNLANLYRDLQRFPEALQAYQTALSLCTQPQQQAQLRFNRALAQLAMGDYRAGFRGFLAKADVGDDPAPPPGLARWQGEPLNGKRLLVQATEGHGDCLQMLRFLPLFTTQSHCQSLHFWPQPALLRLLRPTESRQPAAFQVVTANEAVTANSQGKRGAELWLPLYALPALCQAELTQLPAPYQQLFPAPVRRLPDSSRPRVGLVWQANPSAPSAQRRNCELQLLAPLLQGFDFDVYSLQTPAPADLQSQAAGLALNDLSPEICDFADSAGFLEQLDLLISVDTAIAHLAGNLGKPCWLLLPYVADWRWLTGRSDSPWYPTSLRLFRQPQPGDWPGVIQQVKMALSKWLQQRAQEK